MWLTHAPAAARLQAVKWASITRRKAPAHPNPALRQSYKQHLGHVRQKSAAPQRGAALFPYTSSMHFQNFELEYFQSQFERTVEHNLADSSVQCLRTSEWLNAEEADRLLHTGLFYPEVNGAELLRSRIAALYSNCSSRNVLVTVGAAQANFMVASTLLEPGDEVIVISPGYRQIWGLAKNLGCG